MSIPPVPSALGSSICEGIDVPFPLYHAMERWHAERVGALTLYCSDGRWGEAFDEFCHRRLQIPRYDRWAVPGGPAWLAGRAEDRALLDAARLQLDFLISAHELRKLVLIAHHGCAWYVQRFGKSADECLTTQMQDVRAAATTLRTWYPGLQIEGYLGLRRGEWLSFHQLDL